MSMSLAEALALVASEDEAERKEAVELIYKSYLKIIVKGYESLTRDEKEEASHARFCQVFLTQKKVVLSDTPEAYLYKMKQNAFNDACRKKKREKTDLNDSIYEKTPALDVRNSAILICSKIKTRFCDPPERLMENLEAGLLDEAAKRGGRHAERLVRSVTEMRILVRIAEAEESADAEKIDPPNFDESESVAARQQRHTRARKFLKRLVSGLDWPDGDKMIMLGFIESGLRQRARKSV